MELTERFAYMDARMRQVEHDVGKKADESEITGLKEDVAQMREDIGSIRKMLMGFIVTLAVSAIGLAGGLVVFAVQVGVPGH